MPLLGMRCHSHGLILTRAGSSSPERQPQAQSLLSVCSEGHLTMLDTVSSALQA